MAIDNEVNSPIEFRDYVEFNGKTYLEITDNEVPNIVPGRYYMATDGEMYSKNKGGGIKKHRIGERYYTNEVRLIDGGRRHITEHTVAMQMYCNQPNIVSDKLEINHIDGNKYNNNLSNLEWVTHEENMAHAYATGLNQNYGENNKETYLTNDQVREICIRLRDRDFTSFVDLAEEYSCSPELIVRISTGRTWVRIAKEVGMVPFKLNKRYTDEDVHDMCKIFVEMKGRNFHSEIYPRVIRELGLDDDDNTKLKLSNIYFKKAHYFTRITNQYDY